MKIEGEYIYFDRHIIPIQIIFATHQNILEGMAVPVPLQSGAFFFSIGITFIFNPTIHKKSSFPMPHAPCPMPILNLSQH